MTWVVDKEHLHQIGEVAERVGLSLRTVRYYEEQGLVRPVQRTDGGFRLYGDEEIARLELIKQMKPLKLTVQEMRELLDARDQLQAAEPGSRGHGLALDRLANYAMATKRKVGEQREKLAAAERFAETLGKELRRHRRQATPSARR
jgi:MerR family transcriptional regulator, copper efflux regulator